MNVPAHMLEDRNRTDRRESGPPRVSVDNVTGHAKGNEL